MRKPRESYGILVLCEDFPSNRNYVIKLVHMVTKSMNTVVNCTNSRTLILPTQYSVLPGLHEYLLINLQANFNDFNIVWVQVILYCNNVHNVGVSIVYFLYASVWCKNSSINTCDHKQKQNALRHENISATKTVRSGLLLLSLGTSSASEFIHLCGGQTIYFRLRPKVNSRESVS